jgi:hypothetical protein
MTVGGSTFGAMRSASCSAPENRDGPANPAEARFLLNGKTAPEDALRL